MAACFFLALGLARVRLPDSGNTPIWIAVGVAALWGLSPFLATTHMMVIQRMTGLAGLFTLSGLAAFVWAHQIGTNRPRLASISLLAGLGVATALAALSKENGALLPMFALVILWLWIPRERRLVRPVDRILIALLAVVPSVLVLAYLASRLPGIIENGYGPLRYFTPSERLLSQPAIVLDYLHNLLLPRANQVSPFMDRLPVPGGWLDPPMTLIAALVWAVLLALAIRLRRSAPYLLFGLAFFLVGHLLESGFLGLELYFAHRNYVPAFGLYFGLVFAVASVPIAYRRLAVAGLTAYALLFGVVLFQVTSAWSQSRLSGATWLAHNPYSERAAQFLAEQYLLEQDPVGARVIFDSAARQNPQVPLIQIQRTGICLGQEDQFPELLNEVLERLSKAFYEPTATFELVRVARGNPSSLCPERDHAALAAMADALLSNPPYANVASTKASLLLTKAFASVAAGDTDQAVAFAREAYRLNNDLDTAFYTAAVIARAGQHDHARSFLDEVRNAAPSDPRQRAAWLKRIDEFGETELEEARTGQS